MPTSILIAKLIIDSSNRNNCPTQKMDKRFLLTSVAILLTLGLLSNLFATTYGLKPEIQHKFREPEKMPPILVTTFFTLLVASPALILLTFWSKTVSLNLDTLTPKRVVFHITLLMVLACYAKFWLGTNMFDTMRYTAPLICALFYVFT